RPPALDPDRPETLVAALSSDNQFWRMHAQRLLVEHVKAGTTPASRQVIGSLIELASNKTVDVIGLNAPAIHALWTLKGIGAFEGANQAAVENTGALTHPSAGVRRNAVQVLPRDARSNGAILAAGLLNDPDAQVRLAALLFLADSVPMESVAMALADSLRGGMARDDRWLVDAATSAAARNDLAFLKAVAARKGGKSAGPEVVTIAARVAEHWARGGPVAKAGELLAGLSGGQPAVTEAILRGMARGWPKDRKVEVDQATEEALKRLIVELDAAGRGQLVRLVGQWGSRALDRAGAEIAASLLAATQDESQSESRRSAAAHQLIELRPQDYDLARQLLGLISPRTSPDLALGLVEAVAGSKAPPVGEALVEALPALAPSARAAALRTLLGRSDWVPAFVGALETGQARLSELALDQKQALASHPNREIAERVKRLLAQGGGLPDPDRQKVIDRLAPELRTGGDPARGKLVFSQQCAKCHRHGNEGGQVGPDLSGTAALPRSELMIHILDPSRSVEGNFVQYTVATVDGRVIAGLLASETKTTIELLDAEAKRHVVVREDIDQMTASKKSLMPEGFEKQVSSRDINDLLAFLTQQGKYLPLDLRKVATMVSTQGMFYDSGSELERLAFGDWSTKTVDGVPFVLVDPQGSRVPNVILLYSPQGSFPPRMPRSIELPCHATARTIHLLSGVSGWGYPGGRKGSVSLVVRLHYAGGATEDHALENGVHFADYIRVVDVPGSKLAFKLNGQQQIRYLAVTPGKKEPIERIELVKGPDRTAPLVMAVTVEVAGAE
ncbi:MAG TPA: c-type cytochrome, partial [Isosphaeraceae bacterium]|nr:c-type cytochrome [Isosphaeraceae bacterium]